MSSVTRAIQAVELLARKGPLGVRAVAHQLGLPLGSVHRLLIDLAEESVVEKTAKGEWELSYRLLTITGLQLDRAQFPRLCRPFAEKIAAATQETVNINALSGHVGVCIDKVRGNEGMQLDLQIGSRGPLHCGGAGKAMLAYLPESEWRPILDGPLEPLTPKTLTDAGELGAELHRIRARGYSIDDQEVVLGVWCVGVPILDRNGRPVGALSITGPSPKAAGRAVQPLVDMLNDACGSVSRRLGYAGVWPPVPAPSSAVATSPTRRKIAVA